MHVFKACPWAAVAFLRKKRDRSKWDARELRHKSAMDGAKRSLDEGAYVIRSTQPGLDPG